MHNKLLVGTADFTDLFLDAAPGFLLIDDGPIADAFIAEFPKAKLFEPTIHSFNPLKGMDYKRARDFADLLYSASPQGENTLTVRNGKRALIKLLLANTSKLLDEIDGNRADPAIAEALATIDDLLVSPVLRGVLCGEGEPFRFGRKQSLVAHINRAELGDFDAFVLATLLIGQHKGQVIVPDGGFYLRPLHLSLIRQNRLVCGVSYLSQLGPEDALLRQSVLGIKDKTGQGCTYKDACVLANYAGIAAGGTQPSAHTAFVNELMA